MTPIAEEIENRRRAISGLEFVSEEESRRWDYENVIRPHLLATRLPEPYFWEIRKWGQEQLKVYQRCHTLLQTNGAIVVLVGPRGIGKTTIAAQLIRERAFNENLQPWNRRPPYRKASEIVAQFKALFGDYGSTRIEKLQARFRDYASYFDLMVIDEWHECDELKMRDRVMTDLLDRRYANNKDTLIISNQTADDFIRTTNDSTISRLSESGSIIRCEWASFRSSQ